RPYCGAIVGLCRAATARIKGDRRSSCAFRSLQPSDIIESISKNAVEGRRANLVGRVGPFLALLRIIVLVLPSCLRVIERGGIARELEFLHHRMRPALFAL